MIAKESKKGKIILASGADIVEIPVMNEAERLTRLEERYAHLHKHQTEQDKAMLALDDELRRLKKELATLRSHQTSQPEPGQTPQDERPPHY